MVMWTIYNCESVGHSIAIRKEWQNQISWQTGTFPFGDWGLESLKRQVAATDRTDDFLSITSYQPTKSTYLYLGTVWPQVTKTNSLEDMHVSVGNNCSSILYRQNFDILFRFKNVERSIWTSSLQLFFQEGWSCLRKIHDTTKLWQTCSLQMI